MAKKITSSTPHGALSAPLKSGIGATWLEGLMVGVNSAGDALLADFRASAGPIVAIGVAQGNAQQKDPRGNLLDTQQRVSMLPGGQGLKVAGVTDRNGAALTKGAAYYLHTGGAITTTPPASATGDLDQFVGVAIETDTLLVILGGPTKHA